MTPTSVLLSLLAISAGVAAAADAPHTISLNSMVVDTRTEPALAALDDEDIDAGVTLVQFAHPVTQAERAALTAAGATVFTYLPYNSYLLRLPEKNRLQRLRSLGARWVGPYRPLYKVGRGVRTAASKAASSAPQQIMVQVFPDVPIDRVVDKLRVLKVPGLLAWQQNPFFSRIRLQWDAAQITAHADAIAALAEVFWIDLEPRRALLNDTTVWVGQSGLAPAHTTPIFAQGLYGQGQIVAVLDTGIDPDMCFFRDTTLGLPAINACNGGTTVDSNQRKVIASDFLWTNDCAGGIGNLDWDSQDHGSHVAGTVAGDNFASPLLHDSADGMAPGAKLVIQDGGYGVDNCGDLPGIGCPVVDLNPIFQQTYDQGARIHSNSWGDNENGAVQNNYSLGSQDVDEFMWRHKDFLILFAAGNSGPNPTTVSSPSTAKSAVSVGATQRAANATLMAGFSSCGPTDDGRIKPEITVPGSNIISANNDNDSATNNCGTKSSSGTSMATPGAAGLSALIRQYYRDGFYPSGAAVASDAITPSAALLRATLIHSGENMTGAAAMPANCQGWGRVTLDAALYFAGDARQLRVVDDAIGFNAAPSERVFEFAIAANEPFKATLAWTDYPSTPAANPHLVNDLDLVVELPAGSYLGNAWSGGQSMPGGSADRRNTLEQVLISTPTAGVARITVRAFNVPSGPQPFALVVSAAISPSAALFADGFE